MIYKITTIETLFWAIKTKKIIRWSWIDQSWAYPTAEALAKTYPDLDSLYHSPFSDIVKDGECEFCSPLEFIVINDEV